VVCIMDDDPFHTFIPRFNPRRFNLLVTLALYPYSSQAGNERILTRLQLLVRAPVAMLHTS
jgi:hypothetical protein